MKERIVIGRNEDTSEIVKKFPNRSGENIDFIEIFTPHENCKFEQVPETWEELKELCKSIKGNKKDCGGAMWFEFGCLNNDKMYLGKFLCVDEKGQVGIAERSWGGDISITIFAQNRTPQQMWNIIKSLIGEE